MHLKISIRLPALAAAALLLALAPGRAAAQNLYVANAGGSIGEYNAATGAAVAKPLATAGLNNPQGVAVSGNTVYAANFAGNTVTAYNATTGAAASGFTTVNTGNNSEPSGVAVGGGMLYVSTSSSGTVAAYNAATGTPSTTFATINTGLLNPAGLALSLTTLYVADYATGTVHTYNAASGALLNASFASGLSGPQYLTLAGTTLYVSCQNDDTVRAFDTLTGLSPVGFKTITLAGALEGVAVSGGNLFLANQSTNTVAEYNAATGALINASFVTGLNYPNGLAVSVPEPGTWALLCVGTGALALAAVRRRVVRPA